jgi:hypothetical protein
MRDQRVGELPPRGGGAATERTAGGEDFTGALARDRQRSLQDKHRSTSRLVTSLTASRTSTKPVQGVRYPVEGRSTLPARRRGRGDRQPRQGTDEAAVRARPGDLENPYMRSRRSRGTERCGLMPFREEAVRTMVAEWVSSRPDPDVRQSRDRVAYARRPKPVGADWAR